MVATRRARTFAHISYILGQRTSLQSIVASAIVAFICFFYIYTWGSYFKVSTYILQNRVTYNTFFDHFIINTYVDHIIISSATALWIFLSLRGEARFLIAALYGGVTLLAGIAGLGMILDISSLMSIPVLISFLLYNKLVPAKKKILTANTSLIQNYIAIIGIAVGILAVFISALPVLSSFWTPETRNYAFEIFSLFSSFSPVLIFLLIFALPIKLLIDGFLTKALKINNSVNTFLSSNSLIKSRTIIIYLVLIMILSVTLALIPHLPTINKYNSQVGGDSDYYVKWIDPLSHSRDTLGFMKQAFVIQSHGDRPISLIFLFTIAKISNHDIFDVTENIPLMLGPALILVVYFLTRELTSKNDQASLLASFLTAVSFQELIAIYAGFYANWIAIIIGYFSFVFLLRFLKKPDSPNLVIYSASIMLLLFSHVFTWTLFVIVMSIFLAVMLKLNYYHRKSVILLLVVLSFSVGIDTARTILVGSPSGIEQDIELTHAGGISPLKQFSLRWYNLIDATTHYGAGFSNIIILGLGLYWLYRSNLRELSTIFLIVFLSAGMFPLFFQGWSVQSRVLFDIPFQIPAAIALTYIKKQTNRNIVIFPICIWLIAISIRYVSNLHFILPS